MAKAKYIIAFFLFLATFLFIGESYTFFMENFGDKYQQVGYYLMTGDPVDEMRDTILEKSNKYGVPVFTMQKENGGVFDRTITLYGDETIWRTLEDDWSIQEGTIFSFFSGKTTFIFKDINDVPVDKISNYWYLGSPEELHPMLYPHMERYSGNFMNYPQTTASEKVVLGVWGIVALSLLLLTYYDVVYSHKEQLIKIMLGADSVAIILRKIAADTVTFTLVAFLATLLLQPFTQPFFRWEISLFCFLIFLAINSFLLVFSTRIVGGIRIKSSTSSKKALRMSMIVKWIVTALAVSIISVNIGLLVEGIKLYGQKEYYSEHGDMVHVDIRYPHDYEKMEFSEGGIGLLPLRTDEQVLDNFLRYSYKYLNCSIVCYLPRYIEIFPTWGDRMVVANVNGLYDHNSFIPQWDTISNQEGFYILVSQGTDMEQIKMDIESIIDEPINGIYVYNEEFSIIAEGHRDNEYDYTFQIRNPIILLDTYDYSTLPIYPVSYSLYQPDVGHGFFATYDMFYLLQFAKMDNDKDIIKAFPDMLDSGIIDPNLMEFEIVNIVEWFDGLWALQNRALLIGVILMILIIVLETQISAITLRMDYEVNAQELTIKKVMGYSVFARYRRMFLVVIVICTLSFVASLIIGLLFKIGIMNYLAYGSALVLLLDLLILIILTYKSDRLQIQKVLKGGL